ncbi:MAG: WG repeat-containing protein [Bacteroidetes bacterium]|nr:WG repeat-containing protein [Bacteroidota bacterium]
MKETLFLVQRNGRFGFINIAGQVVIDFEFDGASQFSEGIARVFYKGKVGCIDTKGNLVIPIQHENILAFSEGLAVVTINKKDGYINKKGEITIPPIFYQAGLFQNGFAKVQKDMMNAGCFINKDGQTILTKRLGLSSTYSEGLINCKENEKWGYMDISGEIVVEPILEYAHPFYEGMAAIQPVSLKRKKKRSENLYGFINKTGEMVIPPDYCGADLRFSEGLCAVGGEGFGFINVTGELVIPYQFYYADHFSEGLACVRNTENGKYGFINKEGSVTIRQDFDSADAFKNGLASVHLGKEFGKTLAGYINKNGYYVWEPSR